MSRSGQWCCQACAAQYGHAWGGNQYGAPGGWCGVGSHRVATRLEFIEGARCERPVVIGTGCPPLASIGSVERPLIAEAEAPARSNPSGQLELFG